MMFLVGMAATVLFGGLAVAGASLIDGFRMPELSQPAWFAAIYLGVAVATFAAMLRRGSLTPRFRGYAMLFSLAAFFGLTHVGVVIGSMAKASEDPAPAVAELKGKLPANVKLVSFGLTETLFTYLYRDPIEPRHWPPTEADFADGADYFCFTWDRDYMPPFPFAWHEIGEVSCDRLHHDHATKRVIVGQRLYNIAAGGLRRDEVRR